jgi:hypothetical protein
MPRIDLRRPFLDRLLSLAACAGALSFGRIQSAGPFDRDLHGRQDGGSMNFLLTYPPILLVVMFVSLCLATYLGILIQRHRPLPEGFDKEDFNLALGATLTLLGLIIGFTFSMSVGRYEERKKLEEEEANAIGTEYLRADLLPAADAARIRALLREYLGQRMAFYTERDRELLRQISATTARLEASLWSAVTRPVVDHPNQLSALTVAGMNDVLNSQGYTEAAWRNRVPVTGWILLISLAFFSSLLLGYRTRGRSWGVFVILPVALSVSFFLIADIDSPRSGLIRVQPENLETLAESLKTQ